MLARLGFSGKYGALKAFAFAISTVSAYCSFQFGYLSVPNDSIMAFGLGLALVCLCYAWASLPAHVLENAVNGRWGVVAALIPAIAIALPADSLSTLSALNAAKGLDQHRAQIEKTAYTDQRQTIKSSKAEIAEWQAYIDKMQRQASWLPSKPASAWDAEIAVKTEAIRQEERRGGCGPICLNLKREQAQLEAYKAMATKYADYQEKIEATKRIIAGATTKSAEIAPTPAMSEMGNISVAQMVSFSRAVDGRTIEVAGLSSGWILGMAFVIFPAFLLLSIKAIELVEQGHQKPAADRVEPTKALPALLPAATAPAAGSYTVNVGSNKELWHLLKQLQGAGATA